jgi:hypothetical protein
MKRRRLAIVVLLCFLLIAAGRFKLKKPCIHGTPWLLETVGSLIFHAETNVQCVENVEISGVKFAQITASDIPDYQTIVTSEIFNALVMRTGAADEFRTDALPTVDPGDTVSFGGDIGYSDFGGLALCKSGEAGFGYWPPGPECPSDQTGMARLNLFPRFPSPAAASAACLTCGDQIGMWVNGVSMYNWWDGHSFDCAQQWHQVAPIWEMLDLDICKGHADAGGEYHHHTYPSCLAERLSDDGSTRSPILGYAADGYPVLGPWAGRGILARSCWKVRDYVAGDPTGCPGGDGRICRLLDPLDLTKGTDGLAGPALTDIAHTGIPQLHRTLTLYAGVYYEDYYFDWLCSAAGWPALDEHNGHDPSAAGGNQTEDAEGYHYHVTLEWDGDDLEPAFPYVAGPSLKGPVYEEIVGSMCYDSIDECPEAPCP